MGEVDPESEWELEKLESEVREMAKKVSEYRKTLLPDHTLLASGSDPLPSSERLSIAAAAAGTEEQECEQKMIQLKDIVSRNAENIPKVVKRVRDCIHRLHSFEGTRTIHPAFTRPRIN